MLTQVILLHLVAGCDHTPFMMQGVSKGMKSLLACIPGQWKAASCCIPVMIRSVLSIPVMMHGVQHCNPGEWKEGWIPFLENGKKGVVAFLFTSCMVTGMQSHPAARYNKNL